jgi:hypothetical protein
VALQPANVLKAAVGGGEKARVHERDSLETRLGGED